jgi:GT2 family glycosyltransferase
VTTAAGPAVTVVVVTWDGAHLLDDCLTSLRRQSIPAGEMRVLVVDNASTDATDQVLAGHPEVDVLRLPANLGFAGGAANGLARVTTPYAVLLNNDAEADPELLRCLLDALAAPEATRVGAVTAKVVLRDGRLNSTGNLVSRTGRGSDRDWLADDDGARPAGDVFGFCGAAAGLRMQAVAEAGSFDPDLFLYYEDTDLSWRMRALGWTVRYEPSAVAHHRHAETSRAGSVRFHYWNERNSLLVFTRHAPARLVVQVTCRRVVGLVRHAARDGLRSDVTRARVRAFGAHLRRLPRTLAERRAMWRGATVPRSEVARLLVEASSSIPGCRARNE